MNSEEILLEPTKSIDQLVQDAIIDQLRDNAEMLSACDLPVNLPSREGVLASIINSPLYKLWLNVAHTGAGYTIYNDQTEQGIISIRRYIFHSAFPTTEWLQTELGSLFANAAAQSHNLHLPGKLVTVSQAAKILNVTPSAVSQKMTRGTLPAILIYDGFKKKRMTLILGE